MGMYISMYIFICIVKMMQESSSLGPPEIHVELLQFPSS